MAKWFRSKDNKAQLKDIVEFVVLPRKGKLSVVRRAEESMPQFVHLRRQHSAVESAINALVQHGLDVCPHHGIVGFKRYVTLAVVARNIQHLGAILRQRELDRIRENGRPVARRSNSIPRCILYHGQFSSREYLRPKKEPKN